MEPPEPEPPTPEPVVPTIQTTDQHPIDLIIDALDFSGVYPDFLDDVKKQFRYLISLELETWVSLMKPHVQQNLESELKRFPELTAAYVQEHSSPEPKQRKRTQRPEPHVDVDEDDLKSRQEEILFTPAKRATGKKKTPPRIMKQGRLPEMFPPDDPDNSTSQ